MLEELVQIQRVHSDVIHRIQQSFAQILLSHAFLSADQNTWSENVVVVVLINASNQEN